MRAKLREIKIELRRRRHLPIAEQGRWLGSVMRGHHAYYAAPDNALTVRAFRARVIWHWRKALRHRSQRSNLTWKRMFRLANRWFPNAPLKHPRPTVRFDARTQGRSPVR